MTMTTVAGVTPDSANQLADTTPENRAVLALETAQPGPSGVPEDFTDFERYAGAMDVAQAIASNLAMLTRRERIVLAAALLPEFEMTDPE